MEINSYVYGRKGMMHSVRMLFIEKLFYKKSCFVLRHREGGGASWIEADDK